jgi:hypothetical protein
MPACLIFGASVKKSAQVFGAVQLFFSNRAASYHMPHTV